MGTKSYKPAKRCIYCNAERYDPVSRQLTEEHIVPFSLNGDLILPEASCKSCQNKTCKAEESFGLHSAKAYRARYGYKSRKGHPKLIRLFDINGTQETAMIPVEDYPPTFGLFRWPLPRLLSGRDDSYRHPMDQLWIDLEFQKEADLNLRRKHGIYSYRGYHIKNEMLFRIIAKIAHSYAVAELGLGSFIPLLT